jgi:glucokinase
MAVIAVDLGATKIASALFDQAGAPAHKQTTLLEKRTGEEVGHLITQTIQNLRATAEKNGHQVDALGVCVPGISTASTGRVWAPNIPGWDEYPLMDVLRSAFPSPDLRIRIDSDRACSILGEVWQGAARGCKDAIFLAVGTGIGAGILVDGRILRGAHDIAGAIGWLALDRPFERKYTACGCFEYHASGEGLVKVAQEYLAGTTAGSGALGSRVPAAITARDVFDAADAGDPLAHRVIAEGIEFWGMATANLVSLFNPEKIIFGGGVFGPALRYLEAIMDEARRWAQPVSITHVTLEGSRLGGDAVLYGAAALALRTPGTDR